MNPDVAIRVQSISKHYKLWSKPAYRIYAPILFRLGSAFSVIHSGLGQWLMVKAEALWTEHHALNDVSFTLSRGEALGIIGLNGSGKSTLLQIIAGVLNATSGRVETQGRIAALLELGSGFDPELTGRENIYTNAAILGLKRIEIEELYDSIVAFADIGKFIEFPVKTYSSGMAVRLAFSVQVHINPDILIVDEALAVGDARFQARAIEKIEEILKSGTTLLFVGHNLNVVRSFCSRAMLLEEGRLVAEGAPDDIISEYLFRNQSYLQKIKKPEDSGFTKIEYGFGLKNNALVSACFAGNVDHLEVRHSQELTMEFVLKVDHDIECPFIIVDIIDRHGIQITGKRIPVPDGLEQQHHKLSIVFSADLQKGIYRVRSRIVDAPSLAQTRLLSRQENMLSFDVVDDSRELFTGFFALPMNITWGPRQQQLEGASERQAAN